MRVEFRQAAASGRVVEFRTLTVEEARQLGRAAQGSRWAPMLMLALTSGLRQGELLGLKWETSQKLH